MDSIQIYSSLATALQSRLAIIGNQDLRISNPELQLEQLKSVSESIMQLQQELPKDCNPHLRHYLENCSFDKALAFLKILLGDQ